MGGGSGHGRAPAGPHGLGEEVQSAGHTPPSAAGAVAAAGRASVSDVRRPLAPALRPAVATGTHRGPDPGSETKDASSGGWRAPSSHADSSGKAATAGRVGVLDSLPISAAAGASGSRGHAQATANDSHWQAASGASGGLRGSSIAQRAAALAASEILGVSAASASAGGGSSVDFLSPITDAAGGGGGDRRGFISPQ